MVGVLRRHRHSSSIRVVVLSGDPTSSLRKRAVGPTTFISLWASFSAAGFGLSKQIPTAPTELGSCSGVSRGTLRAKMVILL